MFQLDKIYELRSPWDGVFSICTSALNSQSDLQTPRDFQWRSFPMHFRDGICSAVIASFWFIWSYSAHCRTLINRMRPLFAKSGLIFECEIVSEVPWWRKLGLMALWAGLQNIPNMSIWFPALTKIRNWCSLMPTGATLSNAYRPRKGDRDGEEQHAVPQSFTFMAREGGSRGKLVNLSPTLVFKYRMVVAICDYILVSRFPQVCLARVMASI